MLNYLVELVIATIVILLLLPVRISLIHGLVSLALFLSPSSNLLSHIVILAVFDTPAELRHTSLEVASRWQLFDLTNGYELASLVLGDPLTVLILIIIVAAASIL